MAPLPEATTRNTRPIAYRPDWSRSAPRLTVLYPGQSCRVELACGKDVLWSGPWALEVQIDGVKAAPSSEWSELCWVSDDDVDYLELEISLGDGLCVQRHILLAREDRFLLLADAVLGSRRAAIEYRGTLPLCPDVTFRRGLPAAPRRAGRPQTPRHGAALGVAPRCNGGRSMAKTCKTPWSPAVRASSCGKPPWRNRCWRRCFSIWTAAA